MDIYLIIHAFQIADLSPFQQMHAARIPDFQFIKVKMRFHEEQVGHFRKFHIALPQFFHVLLFLFFMA